MIQLLTFTTGDGLISWIKAVLKCKCCRKQIYDLSEENKWKEFPNIVQIKNVNPFKFHPHGKYIYGQYHLNFDSDGLPYYKSRFKTSPNHKHYELRCIQNDKYNGWVLYVDDEQKYKFDMVQTITKSDDCKHNDMMQPLLMTSNEEKSINLVDDIMLKTLDKKVQKFTLYPKMDWKFNNDIWKEHVLETNFFLRETNDQKKSNGKSGQYNFPQMVKQSDFVIEEHWIKINGLFANYTHNIWKNYVLDINGTYLLDEVHDYTRKDKSKIPDCFDESNVSAEFHVEFIFKHSTNNKLQISSIVSHAMRLDRVRREMYINHQDLGELAFARMYTTGNEWEIYQTNFNQGEDIMLRIESQTKCKYYRAEIITIILNLKILWQFIHDALFFAHFINAYDEGYNWNKYECYGYILTNSSNMKTFYIFGLLYRIFGKEFLMRKNDTLIGKIFLSFVLTYLLLLIPVIFTHIVVFYVLYMWIPIGILLIVMIPFWCCIADKWYCGFQNRQIMWFLWGIPLYIALVLFPVITLSRYYTDTTSSQAYISPLVTTFNDRATSSYISYTLNNIVDKYFLVQQLFAWIF
eukprot:136405_1